MVKLEVCIQSSVEIIPADAYDLGAVSTRSLLRGSILIGWNGRRGHAYSVPRGEMPARYVAKAGGGSRVRQ
ncbi:hypothetical protein YTPLAS18_03950 [Nitrospira sp.]|nr:hypothetical protein YTPLAS18_03950 [Nitrospira sp.]